MADTRHHVAHVSRVHALVHFPAAAVTVDLGVVHSAGVARVGQAVTGPWELVFVYNLNIYCMDVLFTVQIFVERVVKRLYQMQLVMFQNGTNGTASINIR